jgi:Pentapeptide repeats (9 copies)
MSSSLSPDPARLPDFQDGRVRAQRPMLGSLMLGAALIVVLLATIGQPLFETASEATRSFRDLSAAPGSDRAAINDARGTMVAAWTLVGSALAGCIGIGLITWRTWIAQDQNRIADEEKRISDEHKLIAFENRDLARAKHYTDLVASALPRLGAMHQLDQKQSSALSGIENGNRPLPSAGLISPLPDVAEFEQRGAVLLLKEVALQSRRHVDDIMDLLTVYIHRTVVELDRQTLEANVSDTDSDRKAAIELLEPRQRLLRSALRAVRAITEEYPAQKLYDADRLPARVIGELRDALSGIDFHTHRRLETVFSAGSAFHRVRFQNSQFDRCTFSGVQKKKLMFIECVFEQSQFLNCNFDYVEFRDCKFIDLSLENSRFAESEINGRNTIVQHFDMRNLELFNFHVDKDINFANLHLKNIRYDNSNIHAAKNLAPEDHNELFTVSSEDTDEGHGVGMDELNPFDPATVVLNDQAAQIDPSVAL